MRQIDADIMRENLEWCKSQSGRYDDIYWDDVIERLDVQPTVDAVPVKHGRWEPVKNLEGMFSCSLCGDEWGSAEKMVPMQYCPSCGAKMDLEE